MAARGESVVVRVDGVERGRYPLDTQTPIETWVDGVDGRNYVVIRDGVCSVTEADCPDGLCVRQGTISRAGEQIICLPHHL
ncbi:MAG: NusG domain II-containing protein, partial [Butyrivibrio sp.]|nr:NusG domain II-containing protein [Butyrivibrio sp.]